MPKREREPSALKEIAEREAAEGEGEQPEQEPAGDPTTDPAPEPEETTTEEEQRPPEPEEGPLSKLQAAMRELLDYDQISEVRLALYSRENELEKHAKKGSDLGVREEDARRRLHVIRGDSLRFGLTRIFAPEEATEQRDVFFDREKTNGRPSRDDVPVMITFRTAEGEEVTLSLAHLAMGEKISEIQALHRAGYLPDGVKKAIQDAGFWYLVDDDEAAEAMAEAGGVPA